MKKENDTDPWVKAASPIYVVLCRDGTPHPGDRPAVPVQLTSEEAEAWKRNCETMERPCGPHRVQAYRPML